MNKPSIYVGGMHAVAAVLQGPREVTAVYLRDTRHDQRSDHIRELARSRGVEIHQASDAELAKMLPDVNHQGCIAQAAPMPAMAEGDLEDLLAQTENPLFLVLDQVQDPYNLGACLRSAAAAGVNALILPKDRSAALTPAARKVAAGAAEMVPVIRITNMARCLKTLQQYGVWVVGTAADAPATIHAVDLRGGLALVLGFIGVKLIVEALHGNELPFLNGGQPAVDRHTPAAWQMA
jgi:23S rRNA (guanosine2251-2'-O)-methyltransferase